MKCRLTLDHVITASTVYILFDDRYNVTFHIINPMPGNRWYVQYSMYKVQQRQQVLFIESLHIGDWYRVMFTLLGRASHTCVSKPGYPSLNPMMGCPLYGTMPLSESIGLLLITFFGWKLSQNLIKVRHLIQYIKHCHLKNGDHLVSPSIYG